MAKSHQDQVTNAEMLWLLYIVEHDIPFSACENIAPVLKLMFHTGTLLCDFTCGSNKASYVITHGIATYFRDMLKADINTSNTGFIIHFDETTTSQIKKRMDVIRYFSTKDN